MEENNEEKQDDIESEEDIEITTPTQEEIDYVKEMITQTGKVNIKYLMDMTDYSFATVALSRALLEKEGFLEEPEIDDDSMLETLSFKAENDTGAFIRDKMQEFKNMGIQNYIESAMRFFSDRADTKSLSQMAYTSIASIFIEKKTKGLCRKILTIMRDKGTTNIDTISSILRADWNQVAIFRATLEGNIITEPEIANMLDIDEEQREA